MLAWGATVAQATFEPEPEPDPDDFEPDDEDDDPDDELEPESELEDEPDELDEAGVDVLLLSVLLLSDDELDSLPELFSLDSGLPAGRLLSAPLRLSVR
jgi:hypothetical protein